MSVKRNKIFSYRPNHVHWRRRSGWAANVTAKGGLLCPRSPDILLPSLNVIVLNQVRSWSIIVIKNKTLKGKRLRRVKEKIPGIKKNWKKAIKQKFFPRIQYNPKRHVLGKTWKRYCYHKNNTQNTECNQNHYPHKSENTKNFEKIKYLAFRTRSGIVVWARNPGWRARSDAIARTGDGTEEGRGGAGNGTSTSGKGGPARRHKTAGVGRGRSSNRCSSTKKKTKNLNIEINVSKELRERYKNFTHVKVVTGFRRTARIRQTMMATPIRPATPPRDDRAATTALVSHEDAGSGSTIPVAFWS